MLIDVHCHLEMCQDPEKILEEAKNKKIIIVSAAVNKETIDQLIEWNHPNLKRCLGIYPIDALKYSNKEINEIIKYIEKNKKDIWGIGEVGIDYKESIKEEEHKTQQEIFRKFSILAINLNKPIVVHSRKAEEDCIEILEKLGAKKVIMHCFSGNFKLVDRIIKNGWTFSIPGNVVFSEHFQKVVEKTPIEQLVCETDAPYLHPEKGWPNSSLNITASYNKIAQIKKMNLEDVEKQIEKNFNNLS